MEFAGGGSSSGWWALTGTPGTGKSTVARRLPPALLALEVKDLEYPGLSPGPPGAPVEIDLVRMGRWIRRHRPRLPVVVAGHLAHRLPIERVIVLRCHPRSLADRLRPRTGSARERRENVESEALDVIAGAARAAGRTVWEVDTTGRSPPAVARAVREVVAGRVPPGPPKSWLDDPTVPPLLLRLSG